MTYIDMLNKFYDFCEQNTVSPNAQLLFHRLLQINNKCSWIEWFGRSNLSICDMMGVTEKTLIRCRKELKDLGLIDFLQSEKRGSVTKYRIIYNSDTVQTTVQDTVQTTVETPVQTPVQTPDINRYKTKTKKEKDISDDISQTVDKVPAKAVLFYIYGRFSGIIEISEGRCFFMMTKNSDKKREQMIMFCMDDMVPQNHMLRSIDKAIDWTFIYDLVEEKYCPDNGRPSMDPVMLIKIPFIQYLYGIKSMRQTIKEIEVNVAYRWFLGLDMLDPVPHFSTFGKNYTRRFKDTDLFEQIFAKILEDCMKFKLVDTEHIFVDSTHVKACANSKKMRKKIAHEQALWYEEELQKEITRDREAHGKKPLKEKDRNDPPSSGGNGDMTKEEEIPEGVKTQKCSTTDPESGWFRKGEHKHVFAYAVETACDKHGWILGYSIHPGNEHDSRTFKTLYDKIKMYSPDMIIADAGYRTPAIARELLEDSIKPLFPYKRPMTKEGYFRKYEYVYDEYYDCYICPENHILSYHTTNREGYREYRSCGKTCASCPNLHRCTESKEHIKVVTRHVWEGYMEKAEDIRHTLGNKQIYELRKETIERIFGTAKEQHGFRYTQSIGKARMEMKAGLTFACMNLKKLARILAQRGRRFSTAYTILREIKEKLFLIEKWCWRLSPAPALSTV